MANRPNGATPGRPIPAPKLRTLQTHPSNPLQRICFRRPRARGPSNVLAFNLFVLTLLVLAVVGVMVWLAARPALRRMNEDCERIDAVKEAQRVEAEREREIEARLHAQAVKEVEEEFPHLHETQGSNDNH